MNALAENQSTPQPAATANLSVFTVFHLNLAAAAIEEGTRPAIIDRCYWPLLAMALAFGPVGLAASGHTIELIAAHDASWIKQMRQLIARGKVELIGTGYEHVVGPLVPAKIIAANLKLANDVYARALNARPSVALLTEQAYSAGLVGHYLDAGYRALLMDWDACAAQHPKWRAEARYQPQLGLGADGRTIELLWTNAAAFEKLQGYAHGDISLDDYVAFIRSHKSKKRRALCLYASDSERLDVGLSSGEKTGGNAEWQRVAAALVQVCATQGLRLAAPSAALERSKVPAEPVRVETAACPIPVKNDRHHTIARWAVSGRDNIAVNAACERIYRALAKTSAGDDEWKQLCRLWAADARTQLSDARWSAYCAELQQFEKRLDVEPASAPASLLRGKPIDERFVDVATNALSARLDRRRGLAVSWLAFGDDVPCVGAPPRESAELPAANTCFTGSSVLEQPGEPEVTDLEPAETEIDRDALGNTVVAGRISTPLGPIQKMLRFHADRPRLDFDIVFHWKEWPKGSLRLGHITLLADAFDAEHLAFAAHNGGAASERFALHGTTVEHGAPAAFLVSSSHGLGLTEGWAELSDGKRTVRVEVDRETAPLLGLLTHRLVKGRLFCQLALSMMELDDTRRPSTYREGVRRARFSIERG
jgi:hypothetical protein